MGTGTVKRGVAGNRVPVFWLMGNSDSGTYFNDADLEKMIAKNRDAYILVAYLQISKEGAAPALADSPVETAKSVVAPASPTSGASSQVIGLVGPPYPVPVKASASDSSPGTSASASKSQNAQATSSRSSSSSSSKKKKKRRS
jgi:hypothetical protein